MLKKENPSGFYVDPSSVRHKKYKGGIQKNRCIYLKYNGFFKLIKLPVHPQGFEPWTH